MGWIFGLIAFAVFVWMMYVYTRGEGDQDGDR